MPENKTSDRSRSRDRQQREDDAVARQQELVLQETVQAGVDIGLQACQNGIPIHRVQQVFLQGLRNGRGVYQARCDHVWARVFPSGPRDNGETDGRKCIKCELYEP